jgi:DNA-directed RNA polymerase specialized sigma subunit
VTTNAGAEKPVAILLAEAASGSEDAALLLLLRYTPLIASEARRFPASLREDVAQEITCLVLQAVRVYHLPERATVGGPFGLH